MMRLVCIVVLSCIIAAPAVQSKTLRVYHVGNSVTDTIRYNAMEQLAKASNNRYIFGRHMIPGAPLSWIWNHPADGFQQEPYGYYPKALKEFEWDALTLQPFDRLLEGDDESDLVLASKFIDLALTKSPRLTVYIYSRWPRKEPDGTLDYEAKWLRRYTGGWDGSNESREYFELLLKRLRQKYPQLRSRILLVPVGDVLLELNRLMKTGKVHGFNDIGQVYSDGIHFNEVGSFIVGCTFYATLFRKSPVGLPGEPYSVTDPQLIRTIQETVWRVISTHPYSGVRASRSVQLGK